MKKQMYMAITVILATAFISGGCSEQKKSKATANVRGIRGGGAEGTTPTGEATGFGAKTWQAITKEPGQTNAQFTSIVRDFGSASVLANDIGNTCGEVPTCQDPAYPGGVRFVGDVQLANNIKLNQLPANGSLVNGAVSKIRFGIWDEAAVTGSASGEVVVYISGSNSGSTVSGTVVKGQQFSLVFTDQYGSVSLIGSITGNTYAGKVEFANTCTVDSAGKCGPGRKSGTLGRFSFDACSFFSC
jgi:hypothetical protein